MLFSVKLFSWTDATCSYMCVKTFSSFPVDLRISLNKYRKDFVDGSKYDLSDFKAKELKEFSLKKAKEIEKLLKKGNDFRLIAYKLGVFSKSVCLLSYPFLGKNDFISKDYKLYAERKIFKFFYAYNPRFTEDIENLSIKEKLNNLEFLSKSFVKAIEKDYKYFKKSENFDDLSASFGAASILYSETCLTISKCVGTIWNNGGGNVSDVPFFK